MMGRGRDAPRGPDPLPFLHGPLPPSFELRLIVMASGREHAFVEDEWRDALVVVERGEIELECVRGASRRFRSGDVLWLSGLHLRRLRQRGRDPVVLVAISRRRPRAALRPERRSPTADPAPSSEDT